MAAGRRGSPAPPSPLRLWPRASFLAAASVDQTSAVGAYVAPVKVAADGQVQPGNLREAIRSTGPTVETRSETRIAF